MIFGVLTTCHTQYTSDSSIGNFLLECAGREGPSSPDAPRPYVQALCAPFNCNQFPPSLIDGSRATRRESHLLAKEGTV
jgi:hypothetical protein